MKKNKEVKAQNPIKSTLSHKKTDSLVIDLESLLVPISILVSGLMISLAIIFTFNGSGLSKESDKGTGTDTAQDDGTVDPTQNDGTVPSVSLDDDPYLGDKKKAKIAIIEFSDYECPYCKRHFEQVYPQIYENYIKKNKVVYVFRDLPLSFHEPVATNDAMAAQCVFDQGGNSAYFTFHDSLFKATNSNASNMTVDSLTTLAKAQKGINITTFSKCMTDKKFAEEIAKDATDAAAAKINGTPGFVIGKISADGKTVENGTFLGGAYPYENFKAAIDALL